MMSPPLRSPEKLLQRLDWTVIRRLDGLLQGDYRTLFQGFGLDLADLREYQFADDVRRIDWNVTARMQETYVRHYLEDRELTAWFLLDLTPSEEFGTVQVSKRDLLTDFVAVLARLLTRHGNRVGAILYDGRTVHVIPAGGGRLQVLRLIDELQRLPRVRRTPPTDLSVPLEVAGRSIRRRSLLFVVSDFISRPGWAKPLALLARRHEVLAIRLYDPREIELPEIGPVVFEDAETGEQLYLDTHDPGFRRRFLEAAARRQRELEEAFRAGGVDTLHLCTEASMIEEILRFAVLRRKRKATPTAAARPRRIEA
jgi:uncharacterized protein (DUF58 family)